MKLITKILSLALLMPFITYAQGVPDLGWFTAGASAIGGLVSTLIPIVIAIGLLVFIWGLVLYISASGDDGAKSDGKNKMIWGVITLFVMVAVWGIVALLGDIFGVSVGSDLTNTPGVTL